MQGFPCYPVLRDAPVRVPSSSELTSVDVSAPPPHTLPDRQVVMQGCSCRPVLRDAIPRIPSSVDPTRVDASVPPPHTLPDTTSQRYIKVTTRRWNCIASRSFCLGSSDDPSLGISDGWTSDIFINIYPTRLYLSS